MNLSTPVNTGTDTSSSGSWFNSFITGLGSLGTTAAQAYRSFSGQSQQQTTSISSYMPLLLIGGGLLLVVLLMAMVSRK